MKSLVGLALSLLCLNLHAGNYEAPLFSSHLSEGSFEIRDYTPMNVVQTKLPSDTKKDRNAGFMRLYGYITGKNKGKEKIAMTIPVMMTRGVQEPTMQFVLPRNTDPIPLPSDSNVSTTSFAPGWVAVIRFKGREWDSRCEKEEKELRAWLKTQALSGGTARLAVYNEPWVLGFLRRNEIHIQLTDPISVLQERFIAQSE